MLWLLNDSILFFFPPTSSVFNSQKPHLEGHHGKVLVLKQTLFNYTSVIIASSGPMEGRKQSEQDSFCEKMREKICSAVGLLCCLSQCVYSSCISYFFRQHYYQECAWNKGKHDHGKHTGDQSQWRISGERMCTFFHSKAKKTDFLPLQVHQFTKQCLWDSMFLNYTSCPWRVTGYSPSTLQMRKRLSLIKKKKNPLLLTLLFRPDDKEWN